MEKLCNFRIQKITHANNAKCYKKEFPLDVKGLQLDVFINYIQGCPFHIVEENVTEVLGK